jgi:hypothetical protein
MTNSTSLLFIPDISGFTEFIHETEIKHSQHIISELLEIMIDANDLDLVLAEIEGDALFFYKQNNIADFEKMILQIKKIYLNFHHHLQLYEKRRICQCGACSTASKLQLKFVVHTGIFSFINVKGKEKPIGPSIITVHRLLKNKIPHNEYALITDDLLKEYEIKELDKNWKSQEASYDNREPIKYHYREILDFRSELPNLPELIVDSIDAKYRVRLEEIIEKPVLDVYELVTNFNLRMLWNSGAERIKYNEKELNQIDSTHTCVIDNKDINFSTITQNLEEGKWVYGEQTEDIPFMTKVNTYYILAPEGKKTKLLVDAYFKPSGIMGKFLFPIMKKKFTVTFKEALATIKSVSEKYSVNELYDLVES